MLADISLFESLQPASAPVPVWNLNQGRAVRLLDELTDEAERYIAMMTASPNEFLNYCGKFDRDFRTKFIAAMDFANLEDSLPARELVAKVIELKNRLVEAKRRTFTHQIEKGGKQ